MKSLTKIASGRETSRFMLAIKVILSEAVQVPTLVFDEIDVGIGGRTYRVSNRRKIMEGREQKSGSMCYTLTPNSFICRSTHISRQNCLKR